ncbi:MAG TPA: HAD-IB family hydrolase [Anaerolineae bacterium]|nr:HAD-IB family hydrolase [Anaerolineae bacterium]
MPPIIAFFDMDYTTLDTSSGLLYVKYLRQQGRIGRRVILRIAWWTLLYKVSAIDVNSAVPKLLSYSEHQSASRLMAESYAWFDEMLKAHIAPRAVAKIDLHRQQDQRVVLISASTQFAVKPVADYLHVDFLCTQLIDRDDELTGEVVDPPCYGAGKIVWAQRYAAEHGADLRDAYLYTDSHSDQPLLEAVGHPIAVNPEARLKRLARKRGWPIEMFY